MSTVPVPAARRRRIAAAISGSLTPAQLTMAHELLAAEKPGRAAPSAEELLFWIRLNLPEAAARIESILHPAD